MRKKIFLGFIIFFIILILAIALIGPRLINAGKIKNKIAEDIREKYNYDVHIDSFHLSFFLGVKARLEGIGARSLSKDRYGFEVKAKTLEASIKLIPLFRRRIEAGKILIDEPIITLEEKKTEVKKTAEDNVAIPVKRHNSEVAPPKSPLQSISISGLILRKGKIIVKSETFLPERLREIELSDISLYAAPLALNQPIRIKLRGKLLANERSGGRIFLKPVKISIVEKIEIKEQAIDIEKLNLDIESLSISLTGSFSNIKEPIIDARVSTGEIKLDSLKEFVNFTSGQAMSGSLRFEGTLAGPLDKYSSDNLKGVLELKEAEFIGIIPNADLKINGRLDLASSSILKEALSGNLDKAEIKAELLLPDGSFNKIAFQELSSELNYQNNIMNLSPIKFSLYDGSFNGVIRAARAEEPGFNFSAEVKDIIVEKFLEDALAKKSTVYGKLYSQLEVEGRGKDLSMVRDTITGNMHVEMKDGKITNLNLLRAILNVARILTKMRLPEVDYTPVDLLTADLIIGEGKASTDNFHLISEKLELIGKGYFSFDQKVNFIMNAYVGTPREEFKGDGEFIDRFIRDKYGRLVIPIKITGPIEPRPDVSLDFERLVKDILQYEIQDLLPKLFKKK